MDELAVKALAKINLGLDVLRRREDGYHEVKMVMQTIHLYDQLHLKKMESGIHLETNLGFLPVDESNLAYRAARLMKEKYQIEEGIDIRLNKRIPVAAGMAGGSTDAAGVLYGINELFELGIKRKELMELGVQIVECPIVRDDDGLARSSRNSLLAPDERAIAPAIYKALKSSVTYAKKHALKQTHDKVVADINKVEGLDVEYFSIVDGNTLQDVAEWEDSPYIVGCITVYCGKTPIRLIDHIKYKEA